ncbi:hypothetical protein AHAS_Ahas03G0345400 [Arachis hypogaea]
MEDTEQAFGEKFDSEGIPFEASATARIYCTTVSFALISRDANMAAENCFLGLGPDQTKARPGKVHNRCDPVHPPSEFSCAAPYLHW